MPTPPRTLEQIVAEMREWLKSGGLFNPNETSLVMSSSRNAVQHWADDLAALASADPPQVDGSGDDATMTPRERAAFNMGFVAGELKTKQAADPPRPAGAEDTGLISLSRETILAIQKWARDDRLWSTQETTEFNLCTFARLVLKLKAEADKPKPLGHRWTPDPTKRFCVLCGDNDFGSVWGAHRFEKPLAEEQGDGR